MNDETTKNKKLNKDRYKREMHNWKSEVLNADLKDQLDDIVGKGTCCQAWGPEHDS